MAFSVGFAASTSGHSRSSSDNVSAFSMDEAYRRLGHKLSQRVTSGEQYRAKVVSDIGMHPCSAFSSSAAADVRFKTTSMTHPNEVWDRTHKVAKIGYSDRGSHQRSSQKSLLKNLTFHAKSTFRKVESSKQRLAMTAQQQHQQQKHKQQQSLQSNMQRDSTKTISPQHGGISNLHLGDDDDDCDRDAAAAADNDNTNKQRGVLESALEAQTTASATAAAAAAATTTATTTRSSRKCFTQPRDPVANEGLDNAEGNLIVFEGDLIPVTNLSILKGAGGLGTLRVLDLLGQGTFAQVFLCECLDTGARIALKVVKNKQAYTRQAAIEIDVFRALSGSKVNMVQLECYFVHQNHLCLVFELLGLNLYEVLKGRQFRGLPLPIVRSLMRQAVEAVRDLSAKSIVHCDLKPENILLEGDAVSVIHAGDVTAAVSSAESALKKHVGTPCTEDSCGTTVSNEGSVSGMSESSGTTRDAQGPKIKLIDFGSACFEGRTSHTYIQSRFYRSPEVLVGLPYDSAIDMWSLGCVAAELFLGLPILPGVHEHDQLGRISEMLGPLPDWMLDQGSKATKYFAKNSPRTTHETTGMSIPPACSPSPGIENSDLGDCNGPAPPPKQSWRIKTQQEYIQSLSASEIRKKGGLAKLERQPANRYFKRTKLSDIVMLHGKVSRSEDKQHLAAFVDFLLGILDPDPWKRWTAFQAAQHPFLSGGRSRRRRPEVDTNNNGEVAATNNEMGIHWVPPWDPSICRRKLMTVQKTRERQQALRRGYGATRQHGYDGGDRLDMELHERMRRNSDSASFDGNGNMGGGRISPPSTPGYSQSGTSALHSALLGMSTDSERFSQGFSGPPQDMTDYSQHSGISSMALSYGDMSVPHPAMHMVVGPQTYSGLSYEGVNVHRVETEFGYALQRPGVVPSAHELGGSYSSMGHRSVSSIGYSPHHNHHMPGPAQLQMGYGGTNASMPLMSSRRGNRNGYNMGHVPMSPMSQSYNLHHAPTSIREDCSDHQSEGGGDGASINSGVSLLAQQLEAQAAMARDSHAVSDMESAHLHQAQHAYTTQGQMYMGAPAQAGYYSTYVSGLGQPLTSSNHQHQYAPNGGSGFHPGPEHRMPMHMPRQQQYAMQTAPSHHYGDGGYLRHAPGDQGRYQQHQQQQSFDEMELAAQAAYAFPNAWSRGLSM